MDWTELLSLYIKLYHYRQTAVKKWSPHGHIRGERAGWQQGGWGAATMSHDGKRKWPRVRGVGEEGERERGGDRDTEEERAGCITHTWPRRPPPPLPELWLERWNEPVGRLHSAPRWSSWPPVAQMGVHSETQFMFVLVHRAVSCSKMAWKNLKNGHGCNGKLKCYSNHIGVSALPKLAGQY